MNSLLDWNPRDAFRESTIRSWSSLVRGWRLKSSRANEIIQKWWKKRQVHLGKSKITISFLVKIKLANICRQTHRLQETRYIYFALLSSWISHVAFWLGISASWCGRTPETAVTMESWWILLGAIKNWRRFSTRSNETPWTVIVKMMNNPWNIQKCFADKAKNLPPILFQEVPSYKG